MWSKGRSAESIARLYRVAVADVEAILGKRPLPPRQRIAGQGMRGIGRWVHVKHAQGWTIEELGRYFAVPESEIVRTLKHQPPPRPSRALKPGEKRRRVEERIRLREEARVQQQAHSWDRDDWRYRDDQPDADRIEALTPPPATAGPELVHQAGAAEIPATLEARTLEPWNGPASPYASEPRKITPAVLAAARKLHQQGRTWPAIAAELGCSRNALFYARKRELER
jgi:hypothetical protein